VVGDNAIVMLRNLNIKILSLTILFLPTVWRKVNYVYAPIFFAEKVGWLLRYAGKGRKEMNQIVFQAQSKPKSTNFMKIRLFYVHTAKNKVCHSFKNSLY